MAASPVFTEIHAARNMPSGLPTTSPKKTPMPIDPISGEWGEDPEIFGRGDADPGIRQGKDRHNEEGYIGSQRLLQR